MEIDGKRINLKELTDEDNSLIVAWRNTERVKKNLYSHSELTIEGQNTWYKKYIEDRTNQTFTILVKDDNKKIGTVSLTGIDLENSIAELSIIIGEDAYLGRGYGKEATLLILKYAFEQLGLNKVHLRVLDYNREALNMYESLGFTKEGVLSKDNFYEGKYHDTILMGITAEEFFKEGSDYNG